MTSSPIDPTSRVGPEACAPAMRVPVAGGAWTFAWRKGSLARLSFDVASEPQGPHDRPPRAAWDVVDGRLSATVPASEDAADHDARRAIDRYLARCAGGDWIGAMREWWPSEDAVRVEIVERANAAGEPSEGVDVRRGTDAMVAEGLDWSRAALDAPGHEAPPRTKSSIAFGRVALVTVDELHGASAAYVVARSPGHVRDGSHAEADWRIASALHRLPSFGLAQSGRVHGEPTGDRPQGPPGPWGAGGLPSASGGGGDTPPPLPVVLGEAKRPLLAGWRAKELRRLWSPGVAAFAFALLAYAFTRFWRLEDFPIYFHGDEAFQVVAARRLVENRFRNELGIPFPFYFTNGGTWAPLVSTYLHVVATTLFGVSVATVRATTGVGAMVAAAALAWFARDTLRLRTWWAVPLLLGAIPTWFLHSRTTFETAWCVAGFATFLWAYGRYRSGGGSWASVATVAAAFTFYTYTNGQLIVGVTGALLAVLDARHHWRMRRHLGWAAAVGLACALPYVAYLRAAPDATVDQLWRVSSYLVQDMPVAEKARQFALHYLAGLDPRYWFLPNPHELSRHAMSGYPYVPTWFLPLVATGLASAILGLGRAGGRIVVVAFVATPIGASLADVGITRVLAVVVPVTLLAAIGLDQAAASATSMASRFGALGTASLGRLTDAFARSRVATGALLWLALALPGGAMARDALANGPTWYTDYGLYGQQWGAVQVFREMAARGAASADDTYFLTSAWANGTDLYLPFFVPGLAEAGRVRMGNVRDLLSVRRELTRQMVWVMTADEVELARMSRRFKSIDVEASIPYPNGAPGFSFARLAYVDNMEEIVAADRAARVALRSALAVVNGEQLAVRHSLLDGGGLPDLFDGNPRTLARFNGGNPATLEWSFPVARPINGLTLAMTAGTWRVSVTVLRPGGVVENVDHDVDARSDPVVQVQVPPGDATAIRVRIGSRVHGEEAIIHLRDVTWS